MITEIKKQITEIILFRRIAGILFKITVINAILIFLFPFMLYLNSFQNELLYGDDQNLVLNNNYIKDWKYLSRFFTENYVAGAGVVSNYWRPFQLFVYSVIVHAVGYKLWAFHFSTLLFHALSGVFIYILFKRLFQGRLSSGLIALLAVVWLAHPLHNEELAGATGIASSGHLFWMLFGFFSFLLFEERKKWYWYFLALVSFILGLGFKEIAIVFPGLLLGMHVLLVKLGILEKSNLKGYFLKHLAFWVIALLYVGARLTILNFSNTLNFYNTPTILSQHFMYRIYTALTVVTHGLKIIFFPVGLHPERSWPIFTSFLSREVIISFSIVCVVLILAVLSWRRNPIFTFGCFWFFLSFFPMSNIIAQINALVWDHWFYTPAVGVILSLASLLLFIKDFRWQRIAFIFFIPVLIIFSHLTYSLTPHWKNTQTHARFILTYEPDSARSWNHLAMALAEEGNDQEAAECYLKAIALSDIFPQTHYNLGQLYVYQRKYSLAEREFLRAIQLDKNFHHAYLALGKLYLSAGFRERAAFYLKRALEIYPYLPPETVEFIKRVTG